MLNSHMCLVTTVWDSIRIELGAEVGMQKQVDESVMVTWTRVIAMEWVRRGCIQDKF